MNDDPTVEQYWQDAFEDRVPDDAYRFRTTLTRFVLETLWGDLLCWPPQVAVELARDDGRFGPRHIQFLLQEFSELSRFGPTHGRDPRSGEPCIHMSFRFFRPGLRIEIGCFGDATKEEHEASWLASASDLNTMTNFVRDLYLALGFMPFQQYYVDLHHSDAAQINAALADLATEFGQ